MMSLSSQHLSNISYFDEAMSAIKLGITQKKLTILLGPHASGKTTILKALKKEFANAHYICCSGFTNTEILCAEIADRVNAPVPYSIYFVQESLEQLIEYLVQHPNHILLFDECEYLHCKSETTLAALYQIYEKAHLPMVMCGTNELKKMLFRANKPNEHKLPQTFIDLEDYNSAVVSP